MNIIYVPIADKSIIFVINFSGKVYLVISIDKLLKFQENNYDIDNKL